MSNFMEVLKICERASGAGSKKVIQAALANLDYVGHQLLSAALDPYVVYGVRQFDRPAIYSENAGRYANLFSTLSDLENRELTGNVARDAVTKALSNFSEDEAFYIEKIIDKNINCGFSSDTANKVLGEKYGNIRSFDLMLADKCDDIEDFEKYITFPCFADTKLDGERTIAIVKSDEIVYYSRSGKVAEHVSGIFDEELMKIRSYIDEDFIMDGERFAGDFTETMNAKKSGANSAKDNLKFWAFFIMPLTDWLKQKTDITMRDARISLEEIIPKLGLKKIMLTKGREVVDYQDMMNYCNEVIDQDSQEGLILKNWDTPYVWDRDMSWCKVKRMHDADARVISLYKGKPKSRLEGTVGGALVAGWTENGTYFEVKVGSGWSDDQRNDARDNPELYLGSTMVVKYQDISKSKGKVHASLRFPVFERLRTDKDVEMSVDAVLHFPGTEFF